MSDFHVTAMLDEAVDILACRPGKIIVDGTLGGSGHARRICEQIDPGGVFIGIDQDRDAIDQAAASFPSTTPVYISSTVILWTSRAFFLN